MWWLHARWSRSFSNFLKTAKGPFRKVRAESSRVSTLPGCSGIGRAEFFPSAYKNSRVIAGMLIPRAPAHRHARSITHAPPSRRLFFSLSFLSPPPSLLPFHVGCYSTSLKSWPDVSGDERERETEREYSKVYCKNCTDREANRVRASGFKI